MEGLQRASESSQGHEVHPHPFRVEQQGIAKLQARQVQEDPPGIADGVDARRPSLQRLAEEFEKDAEKREGERRDH